MARQNTQSRSRGWIKVGWASLVLGWLCYFALMAFSTRSPWMHTYAAYMAVVFVIVILVCIFLAWRNHEEGHILLLVGLFVSPVVWYFFAVLAMTIIAWGAG